MTNYEKVITMNVDEMIEFITSQPLYGCNCCTFQNRERDCAHNSCKAGMKKWFESEVEE